MYGVGEASNVQIKCELGCQCGKLFRPVKAKLYQ